MQIFFFAKLHKYLFNSPLPEKPKSDRAAVFVAAAFLGYLMLCSNVLDILTLFQDIECLLYLFVEPGPSIGIFPLPCYI